MLSNSCISLSRSKARTGPINFSSFIRRSSTDIDHTKITINTTTKPKPKLPNKELLFGKTFTDHMLEIEWEKTTGWKNPVINPYHNLSLDPACTVFHYSIELFEGMKAYLDKNNNIRLFRPDMNMKRMNNSAQRLYLPTFDGNQLLECIKSLLKVDKSWIPNERGYSLYIRPTMIGTQRSLGVGPSLNCLIFVICSPVGPYYPEGFKPVKLLADDKHSRAWPGGTGNSKLGGNYGPTIKPQMEAAKKGYSQVLWLAGDEVTEVGTMNMFMFWINEEGKKELITPPLDGTILPGVTRDSILELTRNMGEFQVAEKKFTMTQVVKALKEGRVIEAFGAGTAAIVSPIKAIHYKGTEYQIPLSKSNPNATAGELTQRLADTIMGIQYGEIPHKWSVLVE